MITETATSTQLLIAAAGAAAVALGGTEPLAVGDADRDAQQAAFGTVGVLVSFSGSLTGDLLVVASDELSAALGAAAGGEVDLTDALRPALDAMAAAIGPVALGSAQMVDARLGVGRILAAPDAAIVSLYSGDQPRVAVALSIAQSVAQPLAQPPVGAATVPSPQPATAPAAVQHERLELLRGVAMEATVELGRARMTVNELLALRAGTVVELDQSAGTPADLVVNGRLIARGEVVVVDENYGLRITHVVTDAAER